MMHTIGTHTFDVRHGNVIRIKDQKKKIYLPEAVTSIGYY